MAQWTGLFSAYRYPVSEQRIGLWLDQFSNGDRDLAARILDCADFVTHQQMTTAFRSILKGLKGWDFDSKRRAGKWRFVSLSSSAGESGDSMLHQFRVANGLDKKRYAELFIWKSDLLRENLGAEDTVVFVDDFAGTGTQACTAWKENIEELLPGEPNVYLVLVASSVAARQRIGAETKLTVVPYITLSAQDDLFSHRCRHFNPAEKAKLLDYCKRADKKAPKGFGNCGFVIVFAHRCPNNTIPILHVQHNNWEGLFPR
jgi:hypothetical protein